MSKLPISVVMSVYNGENYLREAIESVLKQTYRNFEFIIIDDGSTDGSRDIIGGYRDARIRLLKQKNHGLVYSLNRGIEEAKGKYIARMDADDISLPTRLEKQLSFLEQGGYVAVGSNLQFIDNESTPTLFSPMLLHDADIKLELLIRSPFGHGSVSFLRRAVMDVGSYRQEYWPAEDYDLWRRLAAVGRFANINEVLYLYRENESGISAVQSPLQQEKALLIQREIWGATSKDLPRFRDLKEPYPTSPWVSIQVGRLADVYLGVAVKALREGHPGLILRALTGIDALKALKRRLLPR